MYAAHALTTNNAFLTSTLPPLDLKINGHSHNSSSDATQVINDEKQFTPNLSDQISAWGLRDVGFDYNLVAVFGSQSTGKSTLLNRLFGTNFDVMDESRRQQTTKDLWVSSRVVIGVLRSVFDKCRRAES